MPHPQLAEHLLQRATEARARGDVLLHLQFDVAQLTGETSSWGSAENGIQRDDHVGYLLSQVEALGWRLEQTGYVFVESGSTSSARMFSTGTGVVNHGGIEGMFTFRRV